MCECAQTQSQARMQQKEERKGDPTCVRHAYAPTIQCSHHCLEADTTRLLTSLEYAVLPSTNMGFVDG